MLRASSLGCAREGGVGTEVRNVGYARLDRDRGFYLGIPPAGTPKYWSVPKGIWAKKNPIARPTDCYLDCERRRYFEKVASTLVFWRQMAPERESGRDFFTIISVFIVKIDEKRIFAAGAEKG